MQNEVDLGNASRRDVYFPRPTDDGNLSSYNELSGLFVLHRDLSNSLTIAV